MKTGGVCLPLRRSSAFDGEPDPVVVHAYRGGSARKGVERGAKYPHPSPREAQGGSRSPLFARQPQPFVEQVGAAPHHQPRNIGIAIGDRGKQAALKRTGTGAATGVGL